MRNKLHVVIRHEFLTIVKQPSFWISLVSVPLIIAVIMAIGHFTRPADDTAIDSSKSKLAVAMIDQSGLILPEIAATYKIAVEQPSARDELTAKIKAGKLDGLVVYPANLSTSGTYQIIADNTKDNSASSVSTIGKLILQQSLLAPLESKELAALALSGGKEQVTTYKNGQPAKSFAEYVVPGSFLIIFYVLLIFSVGYALSSVSDEKENRSIEMVLSYIKPQTLILGKLLGIVLVAFMQITFFITVGIAGYVVARALGNDLTLPFNISDIAFDPVAILFGLAFLIFGFIFYVSLMATLGAIFPSAKEASGFSTLFYLLPAVPFWGMNAILNEPSNLFTQIVTYFPLSSPTASSLRNTVGNIGVLEATISLALLMGATILTILLAGKAFRVGTLEYNSRVKLSQLLGRK